MSYNSRIGGTRGGNMVDANPQRMESADGRKWATGRNVKGETTTAGVWQSVEVWTLKARDGRGRAVTMKTLCDRAEAQAWVR